MRLTDKGSDNPVRRFEIGTRENPISGGLNIADLEYMLNDNQSPKMKNMWFDGQVLGKRPGQRAVAALPEGETPGAVIAFAGALFTVAGSSFYRVERSEETGEFGFTALYTGLLDTAGIFFRFGGAIYYLSKKEYLRCDGETVEEVTPYVPNIVINRPPNGGGGDLTDNYNRLGGKFTNTFHGDGTSKTYHLTAGELDDGICEVTVDGEQLTSGYTVNYSAGTVTFETAPSKGTNNVEITVSKLDEKMREELLACRAAASFGGTGGTRLFLAGNGSSTYYYSELLNPAYFPDNNYNTVGASGGNITGLAGQYGVLIVFLEREIWQVSYSYSGGAADRVSFPLKAINREIGCDCPGSIQLVNNNLVFLNSKIGVCILLSTAIEDERNVQVLSRNINGVCLSSRTALQRPAQTKKHCDPQGAYMRATARRAALSESEGLPAGKPVFFASREQQSVSPASGGMTEGLLDQPGLTEAVSLDWNGKYWLIVGEEAWLWDYAASPYVLSGDPDAAAKRLAWFYFDGLVATGFAESEGELYFVYPRGLGRFVKGWFCDFGEPYEALWRLPIRHFNALEYRKTALELFVTVRTDTSAYSELTYITEQSCSGEAEPRPVWAGSFSFANFRWDTFTFGVNNFFSTYRRKLHKRKSLYFAVEFRSKERGRDMNISGVALTYRVAKKVK